MAAAGHTPVREKMVAVSSQGPECENITGRSIAVVLRFSASSLSSTHLSRASNKSLSRVSAPEWELLLKYIYSVNKKYFFLILFFQN